jgi:cob(I)alamin adenosyltransferase
MPLYTRTGDKGTTGLANGQRVRKDSPVINFVGSLDELNAIMGQCVANLTALEDIDFTLECEILESIQKDLFVVGAIAVGAKLTFTSPQEIANIEKTIDDYEKILPKLRNFILPGGSKSGALIHFARANVRNIERAAVAINSPSMETFLPYLNRLSDLLFVIARYVNMKLGFKETIWKDIP